MGVAPSCSGQEQCNPIVMQCDLNLAEKHEPTIFDVYEIGNIIGSGAFGQVRTCWQNGSADDETCAVKVVDTREAPSYITSIEEAEILQPLSHSHIVDLYEIFEHDHLLFFVQERISGGELFAAFADTTTTIDENCVSGVGHQLLEALCYLHDRLIVHRDVKAENVLLKSWPTESQEWHVKLIDFGLAMRMESNGAMFTTCQQPEIRTQEIVCGTLYYCAPEIFSNSYGPKVDVWAVGVMLYLALFGQYPYYDHDPNALEALICDFEMEPMWDPVFAAEYPEYEVSESAQEALSALLQKEYVERPSSKEALKEAWYHNDDSVDDIPIAIREKAYRAAVRAPVSITKDQGRTAAIVALKQKIRNESYDGRRGQPKEAGQGREKKLIVGQARSAFVEKEDVVEVVDLEATVKKFKHVEAMTKSSGRARTTGNIQAA